MPDIFCTKCGLRGNSKCPHCRSIFPNNLPLKTDQDYLRATAQEYFENFLSVDLYEHDHARRKIELQRLNEGESVRYQVGFWTYAQSQDEAAQKVLTSLLTYLPLVNIQVATCHHHWDIMPGQKSSIGCGHEGPAVGTQIPPDPFLVTY